MKAFVIFCYSILMLTLTQQLWYQTPGSLDPSFDLDGRQITQVTSLSDQGRSVAIQSTDGKILMAGYLSFGTTWDFALMRYNLDGSLDNTFDADGIVTTDFDTTNDYAFSIIPQPDGKIIVGGTSDYGIFGPYSYAISRYNSNGSLDSTFSGDGKLTTDFGFSDNHCTSIVLQSDGKIIAAGWASNGADYDFALARYNSDGTLDNTFDSDGKVMTDLTGVWGYDECNSIALQSDGKIVAAGRSNTGSPYDFSLVRYNIDGSLDNTFDSDGILTLDFAGSHDHGHSVAIQTDGKIIVAGYSGDGSQDDFALARFNSNGSLDNTFDGDGKITTNIGTGNDYCYSVKIQTDGKIVTGGIAYEGAGAGHGNDYTLVRYNSDGSLDNSFDGDGKVVTEFVGGYLDACYAIAIQLDGKIVAVGEGGDGTSYFFTLARYIAVSETESVDFLLNGDLFRVFPNPISNETKLEYQMNISCNISIKLIDVRGRILFTVANNEYEELGHHLRLLNLPDCIPPGFYFIVVSTYNSEVRIKVIK